MTNNDISDKTFKEFKETCEKKGIKYDTDEEYQEALRNLVGYVEILVEMDMKQRAFKKRLETEPKGYALEGNGRNCSLCSRGIYDGDGWYDKWGFKCMNCQGAINKKKIPGSLCGDYGHKKCISDISLSYKAKLHTQTIRKLIRNGSIKARQIPNGPFIILRKDNPNLKEILEKERQLQSDKTQKDKVKLSDRKSVATKK